MGIRTQGVRTQGMRTQGIRSRWPGALFARALAATLLPASLLAGCAAIERGLEKRGPYRRVTPAVAFEMLRDTPGLPILDLREPEEFAGASGHLRAARNLPLADLERRLTEISLWRELAPLRETTFLVYCREGDACGEDGMRRLVEAGYRNAVLLDGGIEAWSRDGYGVLSPRPSGGADPTQGAMATTHWRRLSDGELQEGGRESASGLFVAGRVKAGRFQPAGGVEGNGELCAGWWRRAVQRGRAGWLELRDGKFHADTSPRDPSRPFVRGCLGTDGTFRPESREVQ